MKTKRKPREKKTICPACRIALGMEITNSDNKPISKHNFIADPERYIRDRRYKCHICRGHAFSQEYWSSEWIMPKMKNLTPAA